MFWVVLITCYRAILSRAMPKTIMECLSEDPLNPLDPLKILCFLQKVEAYFNVNDVYVT